MWEELTLIFKVLLGAKELCLTLPEAACPVLLSFSEQLKWDTKRQLHITKSFNDFGGGV